MPGVALTRAELTKLLDSLARRLHEHGARAGCCWSGVPR
jgi:hypothetical protein